MGFCLHFIKAMLAASRLTTNLIPIIAEDGFRFPQAAMMDSVRDEAPKLFEACGLSRELPGDIIVKLIENLFKEIAIVFSPQNYSSTEELLNVKADDCAYRLFSGKLQRLPDYEKFEGFAQAQTIEVGKKVH